MPRVSVRTEINRPALYQITQSRTGMVQSDMHRRARIARVLARAQVGVDTGRLRSSIAVDSLYRATGLVWRVGSTNRIALLHHQGSRKHLIYPRTARALRFKVRGRVVYAQVVRHPGTRPNRYLSDQLRRIV